VKVRAVEELIAETPARGLTGVAIKLGLWRFINGKYDEYDAASEQGEAAYDDVTRLVGRDSYGEARAIVERADAVLV
jgi:hypothetical protein